MKIHFTKMHGLGNDFIVIDDRENTLRRIPALSKKLCDRRFGIGADQLILLSHSKKADFRMRIVNADGSEVEMCGNGIRCLGKFIWDRGLSSPVKNAKKINRKLFSVLSIETLGGLMLLERKGAMYKVNMGEPVFEADLLPVKVSMTGKKLKDGKVLQYPLKINNKNLKINCVSMGNPHAVIVVKDVQAVPLANVGPVIEKHRMFPNRTNVEFIQINNRKNITVRVWERGSGETLACGTGASASAVASSLLGLTDRKVNVHLLGGKLTIEWSAKDNHVYMTGPAAEVFDGAINI
jgi:diaminopimelate epimerase